MRILESEWTTQAMFGAAIVLWLAGGVLDNPSLIASNAAAEIFEMAAGALFALSLVMRLRHLAAQYYPLEEADTRLSLDQIAAEVLDRANFRLIAIGIVVITAAFGIQDVLLHTGNYHGHRAPILDVNTEQTFWATLQGSLIFAVALLSMLVGRLRVTAGEMRRCGCCWAACCSSSERTRSSRSTTAFRTPPATRVRSS
jgi:hypothetical protein